MSEIPGVYMGIAAIGICWGFGCAMIILAFGQLKPWMQEKILRMIKDQ